MIGTQRVAVVVPAYDEERWIGTVLDTMPSFVDHVIVVDDASRDRTSEVTLERRAQEARAEGPVRIELLRRVRNRGVGAAIACGYRRALELGAEIVAVMAGDGQMAPEELCRLIEPVASGAADYVKGTRLGFPRLWRVMPWSRLAGSVVLSRLTGLAIGVPITDSQCGFTAASAALLDRLALDDLWAGFGYPNDLLALVVAAGGRIEEAPVTPIYRGESSGLRPWHLVTIGLLIARAAVRLRRSGARGRPKRSSPATNA